MRHILGILLVCLSGSSWAGEGAQKPLKLAVLDIEKVLHESKVAEQIQKTVEVKREEFQKEVESFEQELRAEEAKLKALQASNDKNYQAQQTKFEAKVTEVQKKLGSHSKLLEETFNNARGQVIQRIMMIVEHYAEEHNYTLVIPKSFVIFRENGYEITDDILDRVNKELPSIEIKLPK
jgi:Outer membrane protein